MVFTSLSRLICEWGDIEEMIEAWNVWNGFKIGAIKLLEHKREGKSRVVRLNSVIV